VRRKKNHLVHVKFKRLKQKMFLSAFLLSPQERRKGGKNSNVAYKRGRGTFKRPHKRIG